MSNNNPATGKCTLVVAKLFELINNKRKMRSLTPVEHGAIVSRCTLRFNIDKARGIDFSEETVVLEPEDVDALEQMVNEQFNCNFEGEVKRLCVKPKPAPAVSEPTLSFDIPASTQVEPEPEKGLFSGIKKMFNKK